MFGKIRLRNPVFSFLSLFNQLDTDSLEKTVASYLNPILIPTFEDSYKELTEISLEGSEFSFV